jgi:hypothetical protein
VLETGVIGLGASEPVEREEAGSELGGMADGEADGIEVEGIEDAGVDGVGAVVVAGVC